MEPVSSVKELHQKLTAGENCKIRLPASDTMDAAIAEAEIADRLDAGIQLLPRGITKILMAAVCNIGVIVARAPFEGYVIGLKRKGDDLFLYFSKRAPVQPKAPDQP